MAQSKTAIKSTPATPEKTEETASQPSQTASKDVNPFDDPIMRNMGDRILQARKRISQYNEKVLTKTDDDAWTPTKLVREAKKMARPEDASKEIDKNADNLLRTMEAAQDAVNKARMQLAEFAAKKLNVSMSADKAQRDDTVEDELKELRSKAVSVLKMLQSQLEFVTDPATKDMISSFLAENDIPQVGREGTLRVTDEAVGTPKYRVDVTASKGDEILFNEKGFTKAALAAKKLHAKGASPDPDHFRKAWEDAGNKAGETKQSTVTVEYDGVRYTLVAR